MIELIIFLLPVISIGGDIVKRFYSSEKSTERSRQKFAEQGLRKYILKSPMIYFTLASFFASPIFIPLGWLWATFASFFTLHLIIVFFIMPDQKIEFPAKNSQKFKKALIKRKKESAIGLAVIFCWGISWL